MILIVGILVLIISQLRIKEVNPGFQKYSTIWGFVLMVRIGRRKEEQEDKRIQDPVSRPPLGVIVAPGPLLAFGPLLGMVKTYATGELQIDISSPPKDRTNPDPNAERPYLRYVPIAVSDDQSVITVYDESFRLQFANLETSIRSRKEDLWSEKIEEEEQRLGKKLTYEEKARLKPKEESLQRYEKKLREEFPATDADNKPFALDTKLTVGGRIFDPVQFDMVVGSYDTLGKNITRIAQDVLQEMAGRYTLGMAKILKPKFQKALRHRLEQEIIDPDFSEFEKKKAYSWGFQLTRVAITSWGVAYSINLRAAGVVSSSHRIQEETNIGIGDRARDKERRMVDVDLQNAMNNMMGTPEGKSAAREETIRIAAREFLPKNLRVLNVGNSNLAGDILAGISGATEARDESPVSKTEPTQSTSQSQNKQSATQDKRDEKRAGIPNQKIFVFIILNSVYFIEKTYNFD